MRTLVRIHRRTKVLTTNLFILFLVKEEALTYSIWTAPLRLAMAVVALILAFFGRLGAIAILSLLVILASNSDELRFLCFR